MTTPSAQLEPPPLPAELNDPRLARRELAAALVAGANGETPLEKITTPSDLAIAFLRGYVKQPATQSAYARDLARWLLWLDDYGVRPFDATKATVDTYIAQPLTNGREPKPATIARRLATLSAFYDYATYERLVERNPVERVKRPRIPDAPSTLGLSKARARRLIAASRAEGPREHLLVVLLLHLGLRISEAVAADIEDLGHESRYAVLRIKGKGQATKATPVPLNETVREAIRRAAGPRDRGPLLVTSTGRRITRQHAGKLIRRLGEQIGVADLHPHALRHTFVTLALDEGASLRDVQDAARHADPRTTRRYDRSRNSLARHPTHRLLGALER